LAFSPSLCFTSFVVTLEKVILGRWIVAIFFDGNGPKITYDVVGTATINVVNHHTIWYWPIECNPDKPVYFEVPPFVIVVY
jgi:hypothetical protein